MPKTVITRYNIDTGMKLAEPIRIAHVSDLHERDCSWLLPALRRQRPDIIVVTGDTFERYDNSPQYDFEHRPIKRIILTAIHFTNYVITLMLPDRMKPHIENDLNFLSEAVKIAPVYMSLGNHEQKLEPGDCEFLDANGIVLLDNADTKVRIKGFEFTLGGMSCWDYEDWLPGFIAAEGYKILLCHKPDLYINLLTDSGIDLTFSGHTHGGQIRIGSKGMGFFVPSQGLFGKYACGCFFNGRLIVSSGCSNTVACPRLFNPRELVVVTLR